MDALFIISPVNMLIAFLGMLLYNLISLRNVLKGKEKFDIKFWWRDNWISLLISFLSLLIIFLMTTEIKEMLGFDLDNKIGCLFAGFTSNTIADKLIAFKKKDEEKKT